MNAPSKLVPYRHLLGKERPSVTAKRCGLTADAVRAYTRRHAIEHPDFRYISVQDGGQGGGEVMRKVQAVVEALGPVRTDDVVSACHPWKKTRVSTALVQLAKRGRVARIKHGLYDRCEVEDKAPGA